MQPSREASEPVTAGTERGNRALSWLEQNPLNWNCKRSMVTKESIVSPHISVLNLVIAKKGENDFARIAEKEKRISKVKSEAAELIVEKKKRISRAKSEAAELNNPFMISFRHHNK